MFSFAIWDKRIKNIILGRDRLGIKPLYYSELNGSLIFFRNKSILKTNILSNKIDHHGLFDYVNYSTVHSPNTLIIVFGP